MPGKSSKGSGKPWNPIRKAKQAQNYTKARSREEQAVKAGHPGVSPRAHNGKTRDGYTAEKRAMRATRRIAQAHASTLAQ